MSGHLGGMMLELNTELYQITLPYACFGIEVGEDGIITETAPIGNWMKGEWIVDIREWVRKKGGAMERLAQCENGE